jgi:hypothetical protein
MADTSNQEVTAPDQERLSYLWDQYKYHHGLCWKAVYKIVAVVIILAVLPYAKPELTRVLGRWMLVPPLIGTLFAAFGVFVVNNELRLFAKAKVAHHSLQNQFLSSVLTTSDVRKMAGHDIKPSRARWTLFDIYVHLLILVLLLLSLGNTVFLAFSWIPSRAV